MAQLRGARHGLHVCKPAQAQTVPIVLSCSFFKGNERADLCMHHVKQAVSVNLNGCAATIKPWIKTCLGYCRNFDGKVKSPGTEPFK